MEQRDKEPKQSQYWTEMHTTRMALLMEIEPHSNKYRQVILNKKQFNILSRLLFELFGNGEDGPRLNCDIKMSNKHAVLPEWIKDHDD